MVELPGRGSTYVTDTPGPAPDSPTIVLLHAVGCTGLLTWFPSIEPLSRRFRVVTLDQRWHGRGIQSDEFSLVRLRRRRRRADRRARARPGDRRRLLDGLDHRPAGLAPAPRQDRAGWCSARPPTGSARRSPSGSSTRAWRSRCSAPAGCPARASRSARARTAADGARPASPTTCTTGRSRSSAAPARGRSARPSPPSAATTRGRGSSRIDVPTAVVVTLQDHVLPPDNQIALARRIPGATIHDIEAGHAACVLESERFVPALLEAVGHRQRPAARLQRGRTRPSSSALA